MNNFDIVKLYPLKKETINIMLKTYRNIGLDNWYNEELKQAEKDLFTNALEKDVYFLCSFLNLNVSDNRKRLLITKSSAPKSAAEEVVSKIKKILISFHKSDWQYDFTGSEFLNFLNTIFGRGTHHFSDHLFKDNSSLKRTRISARLKFENVLNSYHQMINTDEFEPIFLSTIVYLELLMIKPYNNHLDFIGVLAIYLMILRTNIRVFEYVSFFEILFDNYDELKKSVAAATIDYENSYFNISFVVNIFYKIINEAYLKLANIQKEVKYAKHAFKSDHIEESINTLPMIFSKEDIKRLNKGVSETTINRVLVKLRDEGKIIPLGKGRGAKWSKVSSDNLIEKLKERI